MSNDSQIPFAKKDKRDLTPFIGHELLYEYLSSKLDDERKKAVEAHLVQSKEAQLDLQSIQTGNSYAELLAATNVSLPIVEYISESKNYLTVLLKKTHFEKWPQGVKWGLEALIVIFVIVVILLSMPWEKSIQTFSKWGAKEFTLAEISKEKMGELEDTQEPQFVDEGVKVADDEAVNSEISKNEKSTVPPAQTKEESANKQTTPAGKVADTAKPTTETKATVDISALVKPTFIDPSKAIKPLEAPKQVAKAVEVKPPATKAAATPTSANPVLPVSSASIIEAESKPIPTSSASVGYLYRGTISITNIEAAEPKITEKIIELGGRKAGSVELGWKKNENALYYHFTIPEARYTEMLTYLSTYGTPKFSKEKHGRVMPDGIIRLIFTVDENSK